MAKQVIKQPNGKYAIFSSGTDTFHYMDLTAKEVEEHFVSRAADEARNNIRIILKAIADNESGKVYYQFAMTYEEALRLHRENSVEYEEELAKPFDDHSELY